MLRFIVGSNAWLVVYIPSKPALPICCFTRWSRGCSRDYVSRVDILLLNILPLARKQVCLWCCRNALSSYGWLLGMSLSSANDQLLLYFWIANDCHIIVCFPGEAYSLWIQLHITPGSCLGPASLVAFDTAVLSLTVVKMKGTFLELASKSCGTISFTLFLCPSQTSLFWSSSHWEETLKPISLPYPTLMTTAMGSR